MRKLVFFWILIGLASSALYGAGGEDERHGVIVDNEHDILQKITERYPQVQQAIDTCDQRIQDGSIQPSAKDDCVWDALGNDQEAIIAALEEYRDGGRSPSADDEGDKYSYNLDNFKLKESKSTKKLEAFLKKRLEEALHGKNAPADKLKVAQDHTDFYRVWQSQLGKNLIVQLSNYCMYSNPETGLVAYTGTPPTGSTPAGGGAATPPTLDQAAKYYRDLNLQRLGQVSGDESAAYSGFEMCIGRIAEDCRSGASGNSVNAGASGNSVNVYEATTQRVTAISRYKPANGQTSTQLGDLMKAVTNANGTAAKIPNPCEVNRYMTGVKKALGEVEFLVEEFKGKEEAGFAVANIEQRERLNTDKVVNIASGDIAQDQEYQDAIAEEKQVLADCASGGVNPECEKYLSREEDNDKIEDEFYIRNLALKKKLERDLTGSGATPDRDKLRDYFIQKGMSEDNFDRMLAQEIQRATAEGRAADEISVLKYLISTYYDNEREALQKSLQARLEATEMVDPASSANAAATNARKISDIQKRIESSPEDLAVLYHYSNVVSSFIAVTRSDGSGGRNTAALAAELENNHFAASGASGTGRGTASTPPSVSSDISGLGGMVENDSSNSDSAGATLDAEKVDQLQFGIRSNGQPGQ